MIFLNLFLIKQVKMIDKIMKGQLEKQIKNICLKKISKNINKLYFFNIR